VRGGVDGYFGDPVSNELMSHQGEEEVTVRSPSWQNVDWRNPANKKKYNNVSKERPRIQGTDGIFG